MEYKNSNKKVAFCSLGCKVNQYETNAMAQKFVANGYEIVEFDEYADVYIVNTCTVTNIADRKSRQMLRRAKEINKDATLVACGCYAQVAKEELKKIPEIDLIIGNNEKNDIISIIENHIAQKGTEDIVSDVMYKLDYVELGTTTYTEKTRAVIKIQDGCDRFCSYCLIPYARGHIRSRKIENVIEEIKKVVEEGINEVVITGIHIASYGRDFKGENIGLIDLLEEINKIKGLHRIRLGSIEPTIITEEFVKRLSKLDKICDHFHLSLQSGCTETLKRMNRRYTTEEFKEVTKRLRTKFPNAALTTDIIVGFPGETEEEFNMTYEFLKEIAFYKMHVFKYSQRKGTKAAVMPNQIDGKVKEERSKKLIELSNENEYNYNKKYIGREVEVLFEEREGEYLKGHTTNYIVVKHKTDKDDLINKIAKVRVSEAKQDCLI
ncbi:MAG: tRNA (N(6)-L-threonylcarbamoyladenosine(37)-C(2))-methylthiotransferase MtaB [Clostridia bacterium]|jgi:threonylcarbamoyladenosine tRNA methylthiotransferase MtaB|nr:2-methylthioadenine synthetase [Clostridium sp. CAG:571]HJJ06919.1 tRNA (N(6)-L-threonylcarbamoyladenosine(37)-C(2))-methylthiotransferase MtaB [Clostridiaceae bacterium]HJJ13571.1 tRNA (N(6)-L-threonylcarbamoyladenosine(37)-C(2))-methylthiotransferase MtaB [Clostridiaceae bacterium]